MPSASLFSKLVTPACAAVGMAVTLFTTGPAAAQARYPDKPVRIVVPFAPGGVTDLLGRIVATGLSEKLGKTFIVDNRAGASGNVGAALVAQAESDGYTLLLGTIATQSVNGHLVSKPGFNAATDFVPITQVVEFPNVIGVTKGLPVNTLPELIAYAKANPGKLNYGSTGNGGSLHLVMEIMKLRQGLNIVHVPYKGSGLIQPALIAGEIQVAADNISSTLPFIEQGAIRGLAVTSAQRSPAAPNIPTVVEMGYPDLVMTSWLGLLAPAKTPPAVVSLLNARVTEILRDPATVKRLQALGATPTPTTSEQFGEHIRAERAKWGEVLRAAGIKPE